MSSNFIAIISFDDGRIYRDLSEIKSQEKQFDTAMRLTHALISQASGEIVGHIKGDVIAELPVEDAEILKEICQRIKAEAKLACTIGVGDDTREASIALQDAQKNRKNIKVFTKDLNEDEKTVATSEDDKIYKAEEFSPIDNLDREKLRQAVRLLSQNKELFEQVKQTAPDLHEAVTHVALSLAEIVHADKERKQKESDKMVDTVNKHLETNNKKYREEKEQIINEIIMKLIEENHGGYYGDSDGDSTDGLSEPDFDYEPANNAKTEDAGLSKSEISDEAKEKIIETLRLISKHKDIIKQIHDANPEAANALADMIESLGKIIKAKSDVKIDHEIDQRDIEEALQSQNGDTLQSQDEGQDAKAPHVSKPDPIHRRLEFAPGAVREYTPQQARRKLDDGSWQAVTDEAREGQV